MHEIEKCPPLQGFYDFIVPLYVVCEKNLADLVCTEVPERLHFGFKKNCHRIANRNQFYVQLHLTGETDDHFIRKLMNLLLEKVPSLRDIKHSSTFFHQTRSGVIFLSDRSNVCVKSWRFPLSVVLSSRLVAIKTMRVQRQYREKKNGDKLRAR